MNILPRLIIGLVISLIPFALLIEARKILRKAQGFREPVKDKMLRPPGESLRIKLEDLNFDLVGCMIVTMAGSMVAAVIFPIPVNYSIVAVDILALIIAFSWFLRTLKKRNNYWRGFSGERFVGEELNQLMMKGYHVFHDMPKPDKSNIDHVIVGRSGVWVVETKARQKKRVEGKEGHKIVFDGKQINFPTGRYDKYPIIQVRGNASWLSDDLSKALAKPVKAMPILTYPGWFIVREKPGEVSVVNPGEIAGLVCSEAAVLNDQEIEQIAFRLEEKCRDVEF